MCLPGESRRGDCGSAGRASVEPLPQFQTPFQLRPRGHQAGNHGPDFDIDWTGYFTLTNLGSDTLVIDDVDPHFSPIESYGTQVADWKLVRRFQEGPTYNEAYVATNDWVFATPGEPSESLLETDRTDPKDVRNAVQVLVGGYVADEAECFGVRGRVGLTLKFADGRRLEVRTETMLVVPGCKLKLPK